MSEAVGPVYHEHHTEHPFLGHSLATDGGVSDATVRAIETEARRILSIAVEQAKSRISEHRETLIKLVDVLLEQETIERPGLMAIFGESEVATEPEGDLAANDGQRPPWDRPDVPHGTPSHR
jgi:cell division protease FtsH